MKKIIIGFVGEMGSGKSTATKYMVEKYNASRYSFSDMLKYILDYLRLPITRDNLIDLFLVLAPRFGEDVLARPLKEAVEADPNPIVVVESIRRPADISELQKLPNFYMVGIKSDARTRYDRIHVRGQREDDSQKSYEEFLKDHARKTETGIPEMVENSDFKIDNSGNAEELYAKIEEVLQAIKAS